MEIVHTLQTPVPQQVAATSKKERPPAPEIKPYRFSAIEEARLQAASAAAAIVEMARKSDDPDRIYRMLDLVGCSIRQQQEEGTDSPPARRAADVIFATIKTTAAGRGMNAEEIHALGGNPFSNHLAEEFVGLERLRTITEQHFPEGVGGREERAVADELGSLPQLGPFREIVHAVMRVLLHCGNTTAPAQDLTAEPNEAPDAPALSVM